MKILPYFFLLILEIGIALADDAAPQPQGIFISRDAAGYSPFAVTFVSIAWTGNEGGYVVDAMGNKTNFVNEAIGRIIYFDQGYYEGIDHNQYWIDWRAGLQGHEVVVLPVDKVGLRQEDLPHLRQEQDILQDTDQRYPAGREVLGPLLDELNVDIANLTSGLVLQNGKWLSPKDAATAPDVPIVGEASKLSTFTTKDGRKFVNAQVVVTDTGISVVTSDGGASVPLDKLPDDLSQFPPTTRNEIVVARAKAKAAADALAAAVSAPAPANTSAPSFWDETLAFCSGIIAKIKSYFSSSPSSSSSPPTSSTNSSSMAVPVNEPDNLSNAVVLIKGDTAEGTGFLTRTADGPVVITNLHVLAGNANVKIMTSHGQQIIPLSLKGAADRDLAMFSIEDNHYSYLELASNVDETAAAGDPTLIPGDSEGGEVTLKTSGKLVAIGPQRVEFDNPIYHGNSGGPVYDSNSHKVVAVVVGASSMKPTNEVDKDSFANANSAIKGPMRYFGLRLDTVPGWEPYELGQFVQETLFLQDFHVQSRALDSFINGNVNEHYNIASEEGPPDSKYFTRSEKIRKIADGYFRTLESEGQLTALQECVWALESEVDDGLASVQNNRSFYAYNRPLAQREYEYRKALKDELQTLQSKVRSSTPSNGASDMKL